MPARRLVFCALLTGFAALGWPAAIPAQQAAALPLQATRELVVVDAWEGYSPVSPILATYRLGRSADGSFTGTAQISVGEGLIRRDTSFAIHLPRAAVDSLLQVLSEAPLREGGTGFTLTHTDDHPSITADLTVGNSVVRFHTRSQGEAHVPWQVSAGGKTYASGSEAIWSALGAALDRMGGRERRELIEAARNDPEAQCRRGGYGPQPTFAQRPRYAAGEAWFARDSAITLQGSSYRKHGLARIVGLHEMSLYATYRGVPIFQEIGLEGTPEVLYVPVHASCEVQPYVLEPRP
jgi:hypothetical protein